MDLETRPNVISLSRQYSELDHLLCQLKAAGKTARSIQRRGLSCDNDMQGAAERLARVADEVRGMLDETSKLLGDEGEDQTCA